ncbi:MAG: hypothetical protein L6W00_03395 [Lentisphaeria bacterium]|nr:MAG: hypothetical protein L6W00_03395 [Lentisphaeria bacterium]
MNLAELMRFGERKSGAVICLEPLHCAFVGDSPLKLAPDQFLHHGAFCCYHKTHQGLGSARATRREASKSPGGDGHFPGAARAASGISLCRSSGMESWRRCSIWALLPGGRGRNFIRRGFPARR